MSAAHVGARSTPRIVLVTGASSGIGRAVAHAASARGDVVALLGRGRSSLEATSVECRDRGATETRVLVADVGDDDAVATSIAAVVDTFGRLDLVADCAGVVAYGRFEDVPVDVFDGVIRTNLTGSANVARHALPVLRRQGSGSLVIVGSVIGHAIVPQMGAYTVSKWGLRALAHQLQVENRDLPGVHIGYVAPGSVDTPIYDQAANYAGWNGQPPPPVVSPESLARVVLKAAERRHARVQYPVTNHAIRLGFTAVPRVYDAIVGPLVDLLALDHSRPVTPTAGNVASPVEALDGLRGGFGTGLSGLVRTVRVWRHSLRTGS